MGYWKSKVLPKFQKVFGKDAKKAAAIEACKAFDESKEGISKEFEEKKEELNPKVVEIFEASSVEIKALVKEPTEGGLKKHPVEVQNFLDELVKIEFPGSKTVSEGTSMYGAALMSGPTIFVHETVSTFVITEEKPREIEAAPVREATTTSEETTTDEVEKEIVVQEDKSTNEPAPAPAPAPTEEPPKP